MATSHDVEPTRTRVTLPFDAKFKIIQRLEVGDGVKHILDDYGVSTTSKLVKNKTRILEVVANAEDCAVVAKKNLPRITTSPDTSCDSTQPPAEHKHVTTTLRQKLQTLERLESGEAPTDIAAAYNIGLQPLNKIETNKTAVMTRCAEAQDAADLKRKDLTSTFMAKSRDNTDIKKCVMISLTDKAAILKRLENGDVQNAISEDFGVNAQQPRLKAQKQRPEPSRGAPRRVAVVANPDDQEFPFREIVEERLTTEGAFLLVDWESSYVPVGNVHPDLVREFRNERRNGRADFRNM
ncbi:DNA binding protein [Phytophthora cinnamomi]|uniref:DNA binding protein n=1 Tax=Phytophthora cinnamomi TaxID=4785 RepID=UPI00355A493D|nr:DNA binding protein [Phytophthora cinnamomi]